MTTQDKPKTKKSKKTVQLSTLQHAEEVKHIEQATPVEDPIEEEEVPKSNGCPCEACSKKTTLEYQWDLISTFFHHKGFARSQINSYNELIHKYVPEVISRMGSFTLQHDNITTTYSLIDPIFTLPCHREFEGELTYVTPSYCRMRDLTYQSNLFCKLQIDTESPLTGKKRQIYDKILIAQVPVMIKSELCKIRNSGEKELAEYGECMYEHGGYFIVNGQEKVIIGQERMAHNQIFCYNNPKTGNYTADIRCIPEGVSKAALQVMVRYTVDNKTSKHFNTATLQVSIPYTKREFPVMVLFRAFGVESEEDIISFITPEKNEKIIKLLQPSFDDAVVIQDQDTAIEFMSQHLNTILPTAEKQMEHLRGILTRDVFPHIGGSIDDNYAKAFLLGHAINKCLLVYLGELDLDDRDHFGNKRIDLSGNLIGTLFRIAFNRVMKEFKRKIEKCKTINSKSDFEHLNITKQIRNSLSTGNWGSNSSKSTHTGVTQQLQRTTYIATISHLRRLIAPIAKEGKCAKPRQLHNSSIFLTCPSDTPESDQVGLIKNMAMLMEVSVESSGATVRDMLKYENLRPITDEQGNGCYRIFVNGVCKGLYDDGEALFLRIKKWKMTGKIPFDCGIIFSKLQKEINVVTDGGRAIRPVFYVENIDKHEFMHRFKQAVAEGKTWNEICTMGLVEYLDSKEEENILCAMTMDDYMGNPFGYTYTHLEIHPAMLLGACASTIPYSNHTQAPRVSYQSSQMKQAIGAYALNYSNRYDALAYMMHYPQKPLVSTQMGRLMKIDEMPAGANCVVAIMCHTGLIGLAPVV
jgi:DNA-directed RNA polymerase II subunit RPB2